MLRLDAWKDLPSRAGAPSGVAWNRRHDVRVIIVGAGIADVVVDNTAASIDVCAHAVLTNMRQR